MTHTEVLEIASKHLRSLRGRKMPVLDIAKPPTVDYAQHLAKVVSKLSPLLGNMIEFSACVELNKLKWKGQGKWIRQDPGFPDTIFQGKVTPTPGMEIKTWFPLATEITARFKDSIQHFERDQTYVAMVAWIPECIIYGKPKIIAVWVGSARSLASARDQHYHRPPHYLVFEPEDTTSRTANLQQTNTNGYVFQGSAELLARAAKVVAQWGRNGKRYSPERRYQEKLKKLLGEFPYRLDTNFAKMDRIEHSGLESFKNTVLRTKVHGHDIRTWANLMGDSGRNTLALIRDLM